MKTLLSVFLGLLAGAVFYQRNTDRARSNIVGPASLLLFAAAPMASAFDGEFAPAGSISSETSPPFRQEISLNGRWQFQSIPVPSDWVAGMGKAPALAEPTAKGWDEVPIKIPFPWNANSYGEADGGEFRAFLSYPKLWEKVDMAWMRREFRVPSEKNQRVILKLDAVAGDVWVRVNGQKFGGHFSNFLPFEVDVTDAIRTEGGNELLLGVRAPRLFNIKGATGELTYPTGSYFGMHIAGVWQDVRLLSRPALRVSNVFVQPLLDQDTSTISIEKRAEVKNVMAEAAPFQLKNLSLKRGWNHFLIKVANTHGDWKFQGRLQCHDPELAPLLQAAIFPEVSPK